MTSRDSSWLTLLGQLPDLEGYAEAIPPRRKPQFRPDLEPRKEGPGTGRHGKRKAGGVGATGRGLIRSGRTKRGGILGRVETPARG